MKHNPKQTADMADLAAVSAAIERLTCRSIHEYRAELATVRKQFPRANIWGVEYVNRQARIIIFPPGEFRDGHALRVMFRPLPQNYQVSTW